MGLCRKIICLSVVIASSGVCFAQTDPVLTAPALEDPIRTTPGTIPVTSYQSGLVRTPNPVDNTGNLIVSGNIGGGKHFRGTVPYNAISDFGGSLGSGTLDDFVRRSTISTDYYRGGLAPYYSYMGTVTRYQPGTNMIITPPSSRIRTDTYQQTDEGFVILRKEPQQQVQTSNLTPSGKLILLPIGEEISYQNLLEQQQQQAEEKRLAKKRDYQVETEDFNRRIEELRKEAIELEKQLAVDKPSLIKDSQKDLTEEEKPPEQTERPQQPVTEDEEDIDIYDKMIQEYQQQKKIYDQMFPEEAEKETEQETSLLKVKPGERKLEYKQAAGADKPKKAAEERELSAQEIEANARIAIEEFDSFVSESNTKFNEYMRSAEEKMKNGKFYLAADDYTLASIYKPGDPLAYAGKSQALFAAGEYLSSALNLNKAIEIFSGYPDVKIDIVSMIGDRDTVEKRLVDIDNWYGVTSSPELKFLQAYIYLQINRLGKASEAIEIAYDEMSDIPAVGILKQAIENKAKKQ